MSSGVINTKVARTRLQMAGSTGTRPKCAFTEFVSLTELQLRLFHVTKEKPISGEKAFVSASWYGLLCMLYAVLMWSFV